MSDDDDLQHPWRRFCQARRRGGWYATTTDTAQKDFELCKKHASDDAPRAVKMLSDFAKFRMKQ